MPIFTPFGFIKSEAGDNPPVAADVIDFLANSYSGTGDWIDENGTYTAAKHNSPTLNGTPGAKYITFGGSDGFVIDPSQHSGTVFNTQNLGIPAQAKGSFETYIKPSVKIGRFFGSWSGSSTRRAFIFGFNPTADQITTYFQTVSNTRRTFRNTVAPTTLNAWNHIMIRWDMPNDQIRITINDTTDHYATWQFPTTGVWQGSTVPCLTLGFLQDDCGSSREYLEADVACFRAYNDYLADEEVTLLNNYWTNLGY